jgi:uncharacterized membrane protein YeaQ/YmgE (transglycosylase-associated protein family)
MIVADAVLGSIAIGVAASLAAMIWPFRRGASGIALNIVTGVLGATGAALISYAVAPSPAMPEHLFFAAVGAIAALGMVHALWARRAHERRPRPQA